MSDQFDCVIVGSGTSGGVIAYYLTAGGMRCLLLEAGDAYGADTFPDNDMDGSARLFWGGRARAEHHSGDGVPAGPLPGRRCAAGRPTAR